MSAVIAIEIVIGIVVLAAAIRFAVRDTMQREASREPEAELVDTAQAPAHPSERQTEVAQSEVAQSEVAQPLSEVGSPEKG